MKFVPALTLVTLTVGSTAAGEADCRSLYSVGSVYVFFDKERKTELKVTAEQEKGLLNINDRRERIWERYYERDLATPGVEDPEREKNATLRALETKASDDLFQLYGEVLRPEQVKRMKQILFQTRQMGVFDHPEVREALKIGDKEARALREAYGQLLRETAAELKPLLEAKKITMEEYLRRARKVNSTVPDQVLALLTPVQRKVFTDLHGEKYGWRK